MIEHIYRRNVYERKQKKGEGTVRGWPTSVETLMGGGGDDKVVTAACKA